jgi:hypothetical protein
MIGDMGCQMGPESGYLIIKVKGKYTKNMHKG